MCRRQKIKKIRFSRRTSVKYQQVDGSLLIGWLSEYLIVLD